MDNLEKQALIDQIRADCAAWEPHLRAVAIPTLAALAGFLKGIATDQSCPKCGSPISVTGHGAPHICAWTTDCECHTCHSTFRGL